MLQFVRDGAKRCKTAWVRRLCVLLAALASTSSVTPSASAQQEEPSERRTPADALEGEPPDGLFLDDEVRDTQLDPERIDRIATAAGIADPALLPSGTAKSAVTPQAISLPNAEGSIEGMGESFAPVLSTGTATFSVPIAVPPGRNGVQPSLALTYSSTAGNGDVGVGWSLAVPFISRQSDQGLPRYVDGPAWQAQEDRFLYNGGQELVPVNSAQAELVDCGSAGCAPIPTELSGWQQYRARVEGAFMRFFRAPDASRWVVQAKDGTRFDFGLLPAGDGPTEALTASASALQSELPGGMGRVFKWCLTRMTDSHGSTVYYLYDEHEGQRYLRDIFYVSPASCGTGGSTAAGALSRMRCNAPLSHYGRRIRLVYDGMRPDAVTSYVSGWGITTARRLTRIEITGAEGGPGSRTLVRRYHLGYHTDLFHSMLSSVQVEGRPGRMDPRVGVIVGDPTVTETSLVATGDTIIGETLPPMTFGYTRQPTRSGVVAGFGGVDPTALAVTGSPNHSVDEARSDLFDVNSDGLPDLIVTDPATYTMPDGSPAVGVFFNGFAGAMAVPASLGPSGRYQTTFSSAIPMAIPTGLSGVLALSNLNVVPMDADGDGRSDLLHMPRTRDYGYFAPVRNADDTAVSPANQDWRWAYVRPTLPAGFTDPRIDLTRDATRIKVFDVNNDHLVDVVRTAGSQVQTWLNLGWLPGGDGRFGSYRYNTTTSTWELSTDPIVSCLLHAGMPLDFADPEVRLSDMNGDGIQDIVKIRRGRVIYWPGRGEGLWGVGAPVCGPGFAADRHVEMSTPPMVLNPDLAGVFLTDVNTDGATDVVQVRFRDIDVWFNEAGTGFTPRVIARGTPPAPAFAPRVRLADLDGSGTIDVVYGNARRWQYVDLMAGLRPRLLASVDNGLGALTELTYGSSAEDYLADLHDAAAGVSSGIDRFTWSHVSGDCDAKILAATGECAHRSGGGPVVSTIVRQVETTDRFNVLGREEQRSTVRYAYHDGYYEGIEQEFRGFGAADAEHVGDHNHPTSFARAHFHQGRRPSAIASDRLADNPNEALKSRQFLQEQLDASARFLSSTHTTYLVRRLLIGLDGLAIQHAFVAQTDELRYDTAPFHATAGTTMMFDAVLRDDRTSVGALPPNTRHSVPVRGSRHAHIRITADQVDNVGNVLLQSEHGRVGTSEIIVTHSVPVNLPSSPSGWFWRTGRSFLDGQGVPVGERLNDTRLTFNDTGDNMRSETAANQTTLYDFGGYGGAPEPIVTTRTFDVWGNKTAQCAGGDVTTSARCLRFASVGYDADFTQFREHEDVAVRRAGSSFQSLRHEVDWDRGLSLMLTARDPNRFTTNFTYDGLGRITSHAPPPVAGCTTSRPVTRIRYAFTTSPTTAPLNRMTATVELGCAGPLDTDTIQAHTYVDGMGRVRAVLNTGDDSHAWVRSGIVTLDKKQTTRRAYQADFFDGSAMDFRAVVALPRVPFATKTYDAFTRPIVERAEDGSITSWHYHALSSDVCDANDHDASSPHFGTCETARRDGHGRHIDRIVRNRQPDTTGTDVYRLWTTYRADDAIVRIERAQTTTDSELPGARTEIVAGRLVVRTFNHDSIGRRVATADPDTDDPSDTDIRSRSWRYLFNRAGDLAATRDPRGCGQNFFYDHAGRLIGARYVGCAEAAPGELASADVPVGAIGWTETTAVTQVHTRTYFDSYAASWAPDPTTLPDYPATAAGVLSRVTATQDRGQRMVVAYDERGNITWEGRQLAVIPSPGRVPNLWSPPGGPGPPGPPTPAPTSVVYDPQTYVRTSSFDHANRPTGVGMPRDPDYRPGEVGPAIRGELTYNRRGLPQSTSIFIDGIEHPVITDVEYLRDGFVGQVTYGDDLAGTRTPTISTTDYDLRRRSIRMRTLRAPTAMPAPTRPISAVTAVVDQALAWDAASNLVTITDDRSPLEWPAGHRPQTTHVRHDALYRVAGAEFDYTDDTGARSPVDDGTNWRDEYAHTYGSDPMRTEPAPMLPSTPPSRIASMTLEWDWLGNVQETTDDAHAFFERSLGRIENGADLTTALRPSALYLASDLGGPPSNRGGWLEVDYGEGGNVAALTVHGRCRDAPTGVCQDTAGADLATRRTALLTGCRCDHEQHYQYRWDELNRLADARRYDRSTGVGPYRLAVRQRYRYDGVNQRTVKQTLEQTGPRPRERIALYIYPGDFERRGLERDLRTATYRTDAVLGTETQYLVGGSRLVWKVTPTAVGLDPDHRLTYAIRDLIGTTTAVIDLESGELVEQSTYYPAGARETFLTTQTATIPPEPEGFTGKEADSEVGVLYFGERYLIPRLGRWATPDPLQIHAVGGEEALNSYHYVAGRLLQMRDPIGLRVGTRDQTITALDDPTAVMELSAGEQGLMLERDVHESVAVHERAFFRYNKETRQLELTSAYRRAEAQRAELSDAAQAWVDAVEDEQLHIVVPVPVMDASPDEAWATQRFLAIHPEDSWFHARANDGTELDFSIRYAQPGHQPGLRTSFYATARNFRNLRPEVRERLVDVGHPLATTTGAGDEWRARRVAELISAEGALHEVDVHSVLQLVHPERRATRRVMFLRRSVFENQLAPYTPRSSQERVHDAAQRAAETMEWAY